GQYVRPENPPVGNFLLEELDESEQITLKHYIAWRNSNGTVAAYEAHRKVLQDVLGDQCEVFSLFKARALATKLTRLHPNYVDMCRNSCIAYTGQYANLKMCPYVKKGKQSCDAPRYISSDKPAAQFTVLPVMATIRAMFANHETANLLRHRDRCLKEALSLVAAAKDVPLSDFPTSSIHWYHYESLGLFQDSRDVAFALSTDGAQLTMKKQSNTWVLILILLNLPPEIRYKSNNVIIVLATPGPNSPGNIESFI
ncbi:hypothetical protein AGABI1DRAFT_13509, partial [Agaricus bisporus var. burnettii JB137-S8]